MQVRCLSRGTGGGEPGSAQPGEAVIPRHEWPGRIVLGIGVVMSSVCAVGLILLLLG